MKCWDDMQAKTIARCWPEKNDVHLRGLNAELIGEYGKLFRSSHCTDIVVTQSVAMLASMRIYLDAGENILGAMSDIKEAEFRQWMSVEQGIEVV